MASSVISVAGVRGGCASIVTIVGINAAEGHPVSSISVKTVAPRPAPTTVVTARTLCKDYSQHNDGACGDCMQLCLQFKKDVNVYNIKRCCRDGCDTESLCDE